MSANTTRAINRWDLNGNWATSVADYLAAGKTTINIVRLDIGAGGVTVVIEGVECPVETASGDSFSGLNANSIVFVDEALILPVTPIDLSAFDPETESLNIVLTWDLSGAIQEQDGVYYLADRVDGLPPEIVFYDTAILRDSVLHRVGRLRQGIALLLFGVRRAIFLCHALHANLAVYECFGKRQYAKIGRHRCTIRGVCILVFQSHRRNDLSQLSRTGHGCSGYRIRSVHRRS